MAAIPHRRHALGGSRPQARGMSITEPSQDTGRLTVRYLPNSGQVEVGCTLSGETELISAADTGAMLAAIRNFASTRPCCTFT
jgi:hypothetical protein